MTKKYSDPDERQHNDDAAPRQVEGLVTVESQRETDFFSGRRTERTFLKMYVEARTSGLLATISDRDWKTLCVLATYMDADGYCFPSQTELARALGCSRQMANERVNSLARFRFHGQPVLVIKKGNRAEQGTWARNGYHVLPIASLGIFGDEARGREGSDGSPDGEANRKKRERTTVSTPLDTVSNARSTVSSQTVTVALDTNKNQRINKNQINDSNLRKTKSSKKDGEETVRAHLEVTRHLDASGSEPIKPTRSGSNVSGELNALQQSTDRAPSPRASAGMQPIAAVLAQHPVSRTLSSSLVPDNERQWILEYIEDFARELNDQAPLKSSVTRAYNLYKRAGVDFRTFAYALNQAKTRTREYTASITKKAEKATAFGSKNKMPYFFRCLEDVLGLKEHQDNPSPPH